MAETLAVQASPMDWTWPVVGRLFEARRDLLNTLQTLERRYGPVFQTRVPGVRVVAALSPDANALVLRNKGDVVSSRQGWSQFIDHVFPGAIMTADGDDHRRQRRIMQAAFRTDALRDYVARLTPIITARIATWADRDLLAYDALKRLTLEVATDVFVRPARSRNVGGRLNRAFIDAVEASISLVRINLWPLPFAKGRRGAATLRRHFRRMLPDKRRHPGDDLFSQLALARTDDGEAFTDTEVIQHLAFLMMAAHDTSTSTLTSLIYLLGKHPDQQRRLRAAALQVDVDEPLRFDTLDGMTALEHTIQEALRLYPPLPVMPRVAIKPFDLHGYRFTPGTLLGVSPLFTHYDPRLWTQPLRFDPDRFAPERAEHLGHRYQWVPFGGGPHLCIGRRFAMLEIKATLHELLRRYRWTLPGDYTMPYQLIPIAKPRDGLPIRFCSLE